MKKLQWVFVGAVLVLPLFFQDKLINLNPWGLALVRLRDPRTTADDFAAVHFGTLCALAVALFVFMLYLTMSDASPMLSMMIASVAFTLVHWLTFYAVLIVILAMSWAMLRTGGVMFAEAAGYADFYNQQMEIGRQQRALEEVEYDDDGAIISYRYVYDLQDGGSPLSVTANGLSRGGKWEGGFLQADRIPTMKNKSGVYSCKKPNDPELEFYAAPGRRKVKIKNWGKVVEHKRGYHSCGPTVHPRDSAASAS
jgi:hypothetical protein